MSVTDKDTGWKKFKKEVATLQGSRLVVGVIGKRASSKIDGDTTLADIASWNEFGTSTIPARSFLRSTFDENQYFYPFTKKLVLSMVNGSRDADTVLRIIGAKVKNEVVKKINTLKEPPNAQATIKAKGSSNPLVDTGRLKQSIEFTVEKK